ncbi:MAG: alanine--tRNA ligase [Deltaproteobacteria bacterium CG23_combo_of_CG06-09_8_20_14_all_60_8]|nr:MAG: alanine--tRNA ligase [Desulfobacterales bacterium CG2_30_60_27]PIP44206.1 MAG: alanine--tRNA ligase [Deltaproteobacteria bacterium CG23_combo_of_CG06-09_8_20_14_all_60_8]
MTGNDIRAQFLKFFADRGHTTVASSPLVPKDDPTLLFTNAGMVQFKKVFMGSERRPYVRAVSSQRCVRAGGKHNDLENVGYTARHHTFFEMLGNFSFGDYFKEEAIRLAWEFLTGILGLPPEKLWVSVFEEDDEAYGLWKRIENLPAGHIIRLGHKDNFWSMGDTGPCGPCSEILIDQGPEVGCGRPTCKAGCDCDRFLELWNLVFMQFNRDADGTLTPLPKPSIDTGMGLERVAAVLQGKHNNYDSDLFAGLMTAMAEISGHRYGADQQIDTAFRVIADHARATANLVADGVLPANEGRGYVLRRIMRRAIRYGRVLGLHKPFFSAITAAAAQGLAEVFPHLLDARELLAKVVRNEEERFLETIDNGLGMLHDELARMAGAGEGQVAGDFIFRLYDTYGFPVDIVRDIALEKGLTVDEAGFLSAMEKQRQLSKKSWKGTAMASLGEGIRNLLESLPPTVFTGYETRRGQATITGLISGAGLPVSRAMAGDEVMIICPETPFYAEAGGQAGDQGELVGPQGRAQVLNTVPIAQGRTAHQARVTEGSLGTGEAVELKVTEGRRQKIADNHTATHLLQATLRQVLGEHVKQSGSLVDPERLRFDFTHFSPLTGPEIMAVETMVNEEIRANRQVTTAMLSRAEAQQSGAMALFGEKYGDTVRVVSAGDFSKELCGGTHVGATGEIGLMKIIAETGIAAGVRRIEAVTGPAAFQRLQDHEQLLSTLADRLRCGPEELTVRVEKLLARQKELEREVGRLTAKLSTTDLDAQMAGAKTVDNIRIVTLQVPLDSAKTLREVGDRVRDKLGSGAAILGGVLEDKVALLAIVSKDLVGRLHAGNIIKEVATLVDGSGGGRPDMAQAGGTRPDKLAHALAQAAVIIEKQIAATA